MLNLLRFLVLSGTIIMMMACSPIVPATTPPQLDHTPGAFVVVTDATYSAGVFQVDYPSDWRIVKTSIASDENQQVVFVAPDESSLTLTQIDFASESSETETFITLENDVTLQIVLQMSDDADVHTKALMEQAVASIRP